MEGWCAIRRLDLRYASVTPRLDVGLPPRADRLGVKLGDLPPGRYVDVPVRFGGFDDARSNREQF